ncbi:11700_t:CDS:2 [Acaulospora morrowiae]|uniref:11700_t:CDS:1 n=1 Tax=Acaulospora morrowiae TaxID=94023 RepID=A0A9N9E4X7_9GLOM|nr:11700_t:CDS:2 [Acaulospora morrowiae]
MKWSVSQGACMLRDRGTISSRCHYVIFDSVDPIARISEDHRFVDGLGVIRLSIVIMVWSTVSIVCLGLGVFPRILCGLALPLGQIFVEDKLAIYDVPSVFELL